MKNNLHEIMSESDNPGLDSADSGFCGFWNNTLKHEDKSNFQNPEKTTWILEISGKFPVFIWVPTMFSESMCSPIYLRYISHTPTLALGCEIRIWILDSIFGRGVLA